MLFDRTRMTGDTISQIATPHGMGGIGIIRMSGADALPIAQHIFHPAKGGALGEVAPYTARFGQVRAADGAILDEVIHLYMRASHAAPFDTYRCHCRRQSLKNRAPPEHSTAPFSNRQKRCSSLPNNGSACPVRRFL